MKQYIISLLLIILLFSCKKDIIDSNQTATLHFSTDTIIFDTTFHSIGTPTRTLIIYKHNGYTLLTDISLNTVNNGEMTNDPDCESLDPDFESYNIFWVDNDYSGTGLDKCFGEVLVTAGSITNPQGAAAMVGPSDLDTDTRFNFL